MFLTEWPETMVTFANRNNPKLVRDPTRTVICFFDSDANIYPRLERVLDNLSEYKRFMAVVGMDVTFTGDMDVELQQLIILINHMFTMILAINGIKIMLNTRSGGLSYSYAFGCVPKGVSVACGFLGCNKLKEGDFSFIGKILYLMPSKVCIYGKQDPLAEKQLDQFGFWFRVYKDVHRRTKEREVYYG